MPQFLLQGSYLSDASLAAGHQIQFWKSGGLAWVIVSRLLAPSPASLCLLLEGIHHLSACYWTSVHIYGSTWPGGGKQVTWNMTATTERGFRMVCGFSFRSDERKKKKSKPKPSRLPARVCEIRSKLKPVSAKREITGLKWETSLHKTPVVFGISLFAYICVYVDVFFKVRLLFMYVFSPKTLFKNSVETVL